jgi:hypothetical protein
MVDWSMVNVHLPVMCLSHKEPQNRNSGMDYL